MIRRTTAVLADLAAQLEARAAAVTLVRSLPDAGRSLVAAQDIPQGTVIHTEAPMLATPAASALDSTCSGCLRPVPAAGGGRACRFCSPECEREARGSWLQVHERCDFGALRAACAESGEKFPLLAARLACATVQRQGAGSGETDSSAEPHPLPQDVLRGDPLRVSGGAGVL